MESSRTLKGTIVVQLDQAAYEAADRFMGRIVVDAEEEMSVEEFRIEIRALMCAAQSTLLE